MSSNLDGGIGAHDAVIATGGPSTLSSDEQEALIDHIASRPATTEEIARIRALFREMDALIQGARHLGDLALSALEKGHWGQCRKTLERFEHFG